MIRNRSGWRSRILETRQRMPILADIFLFIVESNISVEEMLFYFVMGNYNYNIQNDKIF